MRNSFKLKGFTVKARMLWILLPLVILCIVALSLIAHQLSKNLLMKDYEIQKKYIVANVVRSMNLIESGYGMLDTQLEKVMTEDVLHFKALYDASAKPVDLDLIKSQMDNQYELAIIDNETTIIDTTLKEALQFNFMAFDQTLGQKIDGIRLSRKVAHERIRTNVVNGLLSKFSYVASGDGAVLLEIVYSNGDFAANVESLDPVRTLENLEESNPYVTDIKAFDVYGYAYTNSGELSEPTPESIANVKRAVAEKAFEIPHGSQSVCYAYIPDTAIDPLSDHGKIVEISFDSSTLELVIKRLALIMLSVGVAIALISAYLIYWLVKRITSPITTLSQAANAIAEGDYTVHIEATADDEIGHLSSIFNTMTVRIRDAYAEIENQLKTTLQSMGDALISTNEKGEVVIINKEAELLTGWSYDEAKGRPIEEIFIVKKDKRHSAKDQHLVLVHRTKGEIPIENSVSPIVNTEGKIQGSVVVFRDITEKKEKLGQIEYLSYHDQLTGLFNRRYFEEAIHRHNENQYYPLTLVMLDVNGLKLVNDAFGHQMGDRLLKCAADTLRNAMRVGDVLARLDGDEFVMILPCTDHEAADQLMSRLNAIIKSTTLESIQLSISYGMATQYSDRVELMDVYKLAEDHMYRRKLRESTAMRQQTIELIIDTLKNRNKNYQRHSERVSALCEAMGIHFGFTEEQLSNIRTLGLVHDIGKIAIPEALYNKEEGLSETERLEIERHPEVGYQILKSVNEYARLSESVLAHHEKYDGTGYPMGKKEEGIPLEARILAVANAYDFLCTDSENHQAYSHEEAIEALKDRSGKSFDPSVVEAFAALKLMSH